MIRIKKPVIDLLLTKGQFIASKDIHRVFMEVLRSFYPNLSDIKLQSLAAGSVGGSVSNGTLVYINNGKLLKRIK
ncbi:hypothetical protein JMJ99_04130 [Companilactobacillus zhachilii]|uniref:hypothetical protein n=1 Tax=Companilactobacillus zhachilii TaxID=2304606 RepID=UPI00192101AF|nr:hypothetical protein [Companilactobacillus zhachilii]MBL3530547.1 hypothetical protein [Companilactobacillus zhachilii]